jgi:plasmid stability protein
MNVRPLPAIRTDRAWLDREALRVAAGVHGASRDNVARNVFMRHTKNGVSEEEAANDAALALAWIDARLEQIAVMRSTPAPLPEALRWKA